MPVYQYLTKIFLIVNLLPSATYAFVHEWRDGLAIFLILTIVEQVAFIWILRRYFVAAWRDRRR